MRKGARALTEREQLRRNTEVTRLYRAGMTLDEIGLGLRPRPTTREGVRWYIAQYGLDIKVLTAEKRARARALRQLAREFERSQPRTDGARCRICGCLLGHGRELTCSPAHATAWRIGRYRIDPAKHAAHRLSQARSILRRAAAGAPTDEAKLNWARRTLGPEGTEPNRRYHVPTSHTSAVVEAVAAELKEAQ